MNVNEVNWILENALRSTVFLKNTEWYLFGSVLTSKKGSSDIDLLILYNDARDPIKIRKRISGLALLRPLDLIFMTPEEERELDFVKSEKCVQIFPHNTIDSSVT